MDLEKQWLNGAWLGKTTLLRNLIESNPELLEIRNDQQQTALYLATKNQKYDTVHFLLEIGADVNIQEYEKWTPLHRAAYDDNIELVELLMKKGANQKLRTKTEGKKASELGNISVKIAISNYVVTKTQKLEAELQL